MVAAYYQPDEFDANELHSFEEARRCLRMLDARRREYLELLADANAKKPGLYPAAVAIIRELEQMISATLLRMATFPGHEVTDEECQQLLAQAKEELANRSKRRF